MNAIVTVLGGNVEAALKRLKRYLGRSGVLREIREREAYVAPSKRRRLKSARARTRARRDANRRTQWESPDDA